MNLLNILKSSFKFLDKHNYKIWTSSYGKQYRKITYLRQKKNGESPLIDNPSVEDIKNVFNKYNAKNILEVGCGWGRLLEELQNDYNIEGCDVAKDYLELCPPNIKTYFQDITKLDDNFKGKKWDILFTRGVMFYLINDQQLLKLAMINMANLADKKVIIWEWPNVCEIMKNTHIDEKFEYCPILIKSE